jgi:hypothetical protein
LKGRIGQKVLAVLGKGTAKPGQSAPWILVDATTDNECVNAATTYIAGVVANELGATEPEVEQLSKDSGNPALAAALGKLGARK